MRVTVPAVTTAILFAVMFGSVAAMIYGVNYGPRRLATLDASTGCPAYADILTDLQLAASKLAPRVKTFHLEDPDSPPQRRCRNGELVLRAVAAINAAAAAALPGRTPAAAPPPPRLELWMGMAVGSDTGLFDSELRELVRLAKTYPDAMKHVYAIVVGSEALFRGNIGPPALAAHVRDVRAALSTLAPAVRITVADVAFPPYFDPALLHELDFATVNIYPFWESYNRRDAVDYQLRAFRKAETRAQSVANLSVVLGEVGWPSQGDSMGAATPSVDDLRAFFTGNVLASSPRRVI
ncbi:hypothetical protein HK405_004441 [Cladochytrium tenue]|nr:hypothetical protein HK405_004441 [Cladochytrium tenue]